VAVAYLDWEQDLILITAIVNSTIGDRAFPVAAARVLNSLPQHVTSSPSVAVIRSHLKTHLFSVSYPTS